jgi:hypothetical protein
VSEEVTTMAQPKPKPPSGTHTPISTGTVIIKKPK